MRLARPSAQVCVCVFVCALRLYPNSPGRGVRCASVRLRSSFGCSPRFLAWVLGCVSLCARSGCTPPILARVYVACVSVPVIPSPLSILAGGAGLCVFVCALCLYPAHPGSGLWCLCCIRVRRPKPDIPHPITTQAWAGTTLRGTSSFCDTLRAPAVCPLPAGGPLPLRPWTLTQPRGRVRNHLSRCPRAPAPRPIPAHPHSAGLGRLLQAQRTVSPHDSTARIHVHAEAYPQAHERACASWWQRWTHTQLSAGQGVRRIMPCGARGSWGSAGQAGVAPARICASVFAGWPGGVHVWGLAGGDVPQAPSFPLRRLEDPLQAPEDIRVVLGCRELTGLESVWMERICQHGFACSLRHPSPRRLEWAVLHRLFAGPEDQTLEGGLCPGPRPQP